MYDPCLIRKHLEKQGETAPMARIRGLKADFVRTTFQYRQCIRRRQAGCWHIVVLPTSIILERSLT